MGAIGAGVVVDQRIRFCRLTSRRDMARQQAHRFTPCSATPLSRRAMLERSGFRLGMLGLASLLSADGRLVGHVRGAESYTNPMASQAAAVAGQGEACDSPVHEWRSVASRHVRSQAIAQRIRRQNPAARKPEDRAQNRGRVSLAIQIQEVRPKRHRGERDFLATWRVDRRHLRHPLDACRRAEPRAVADVDELRRSRGCCAPALVPGSPMASEPRTRTCLASSCMCPGGHPIKGRRTGNPPFLPGVYQGTLHQHPAHGNR